MSNQAASPGASHKRYFFEKFAITERLLDRCLGEALSAGGDYADLYFESVTATSLGVDEQIVKTASQGTSAGCAFGRSPGTHRLRLHRQSQSRTTAPCGAHRGAYRLRPGHAIRAWLCRDTGRRSLSGSPGWIRSRSGCPPGTDPACGPHRALLRSPDCASARQLQRRAAPHPDRGLRWRFRQRHATPLPS